MNQFAETLRQYHLKATPQRIEIANTLHRRGHASIDELYSILLEKFNSISLATIYKNVNIMMENAFIQEVKLPQQKSVYELSKEAHSHLVCQSCGMVEDISLDLQSIRAHAQSKTDLQINKADLVFSGLCKNCQ